MFQRTISLPILYLPTIPPSLFLSLYFPSSSLPPYHSSISFSLSISLFPSIYLTTIPPSLSLFLSLYFSLPLSLFLYFPLSISLRFLHLFLSLFLSSSLYFSLSLPLLYLPTIPPSRSLSISLFPFLFSISLPFLHLFLSFPLSIPPPQKKKNPHTSKVLFSNIHTPEYMNVDLTTMI